MYKWEDYLNVELMKGIYPDEYHVLGGKLFELMKPYIEVEDKRDIDHNKSYSEKDVILITYGDSIIKDGEKPLKTLGRFAKKHLKGYVSAIHLLPIYPYTSDDGFSVVDYLEIDKRLGSWQDANGTGEFKADSIGGNFELMLDAVVNHISKRSEWFLNYQKGIKPYTYFFTEKNAEFDISKVIRPRALPLFHKYNTVYGPKELWTTFSEDQVDLNFRSIDCVLEVAKVLLSYGDHGAKYIRLDAIGFIWKQSGTTCMHLQQTHDLIKLFRQMFDVCFGDVKLITETNVPHNENIRYFGNGFDEAHMVYQFPLPPLLLFSFMTENVTKLTRWLGSIKPPSEETSFFNFLASHDGIGMRPTEGILTSKEKDLMVSRTLSNGGRIGYKNNADGTKSAYELNINYMDALFVEGMSEDDLVDKFIASQSILLSVQGVPGIYIHSLLGSSNDEVGVETTGINRRINREKLKYNKLETELRRSGRRHHVLSKMKRLLEVRKGEKAFSPLAKQEVIESETELFILRRGTQDSVLVIVNVSAKDIQSEILAKVKGKDLISGKAFSGNRLIRPYEILWINSQGSDPT